MKKFIAFMLAALPLAWGVSEAQVPVQKKAEEQRTLRKAPVVEGRVMEIRNAGGMERRLARGRSAAVPTLDIGVKGFGEAQNSWSESFNGGTLPGGWVIEGCEDIEWGVKLMTGTHSFSQTDPDDAGSLYVSGPYQVFKRGIAWATSPEVTVGKNCTLEGWIGFSRNFDDECRLSISASADGFETDIMLWNSGDDTGERPWHWRKISLPLDELAGQTVRLRFTYGPGGKDSFGTGGYSGDFAIDCLSIAGPATVESVDVTTGDVLQFVASGVPDGCGFSWSFPGGVPEKSTEASPEVYYTADGVYDVSLELTGAEGAVTRTGFVKVTGTAPVAKIGYPATFKDWSSRLPMVAPMAEVTFTDASTGFPSDHNWVFTGVSEDGTSTVASADASPVVRYNFRHAQGVGLNVSNSHGSSDVFGEVAVEYDGLVTNFCKDDVATVFDLDGESSFPGSNKWGITAYAERFSAPSVPMKVFGAYVYFVKNDAEEVVDQIASVGVHICASEDGKPGRRLDSMWWDVFELDMPSADGLIGTEFPFTEAPVVDDEFFIVIDGIPARNETCNVQFAMAQFRGDGNTALFQRDGKWVEASDYFPAGANHTSYLVALDMGHSVIESLPAGRRTVEVGADAGEAGFDIFSFFGWKPEMVGNDADWCCVTSEPNGMTVDCIKISYDAMPASAGDRREAHLTFTDGMSALPLTLVQLRTSGVTGAAYRDDALLAYDKASAVVSGGEGLIVVTDQLGRRVASGIGRAGVGSLPAGIYIARCGEAALKFVR